MPLFNPPAVGSPPDALYYTAASNSLLTAEIPLGRSIALGDRPPATPGTYDEEWEGTADTLPANWAWTAAPSGSDASFLNSRWPSLLTVEGTGNTNYTLKRTSFTAAATFGIWAHAFVAPLAAADKAICRMYVMNAGETEGREVELRVTAAGAAAARSLKTIASVESAWGTAIGLTGATDLYIGMTRTSGNWVAWASLNGIAWFNIGGTESHTITIDRIRFTIGTHSSPSAVGLDWVRYRTDTDFPRP